jgi:fluoride exporter
VSVLVAAVLVAVGGAIGAPLRYVTDLVVQSVHDTVFPWGTFTVNVVGSLILGGVAGAVAAGAPAWLLTLIGTGLCGALTTFSTFGIETVRLIEDGAVFEAALNSLTSLLVGLVACMGAFALTSTIG